MVRYVNAASGHRLHVSPMSAEDVAALNLRGSSEYSEFYVVRNGDADGCVFFYLAKGYKTAPKEIVVWYRNKKFWSGYGKTFKDAIDGAQRDGWMSATR